MKETLVTHISDDEMVLERRPLRPADDVLTQRPVQDPVRYPVMETWLTGHVNGYLGDPQPSPQLRVWHRFAPGCWHDLFSASDQELAGMGLATIGNICRWVAEQRLSTHADAKLVLKMASWAEEMPLPWPGMETDAPLPLDLAKLPFLAAMFLQDEDGQFKYRVDRLALMNRIEAVFVPHLKGVLEARV